MNNTETFVNCLKGKSVDSLLNTKIIFGELANFAQMWWRPTAEPESDGAFLTDSPRNLIRQNKMKDLPFMTGEVTDEGLVNTASKSFLNLINQIQFILKSTFRLIFYFSFTRQHNIVFVR